MVGRRFPLFSKDFMVSAPELASLVHLPVGAEEHGVDYSKPGRTESGKQGYCLHVKREE